MFDNPPAGRGATNGRRLTIYDVFGSNPSDKEHYVFYDVEFVYNIQDPSLNNEICYWNRLPRNEEEANQLFAMANEGDAMAMLTLGQWFGTKLTDRLDIDKMKMVVYVFIGISGLITIMQYIR